MSLSILLVEDDDVAAEAVVRSLRKHGIDVPVTIAQDGQEALDLLRHRVIPKPFVVLLDLNMPRMNGFEFMQVVRQDTQLQDSVIFVLTTSDSEQDRTRAYANHIAGYMVKSSVGPQFAKLVALLNSYRAAVKLPGD